MQVLGAACVAEMLTLWHAGAPKAEVARRLGVDRKTVRGYTQVAERAGWRPGCGARPDWDRLVVELFPRVADEAQRRSTWRELDRHETIVGELLRTLPVATAHRVLREDHGVTASLASFRRYARAHPPAQAQVAASASVGESRLARTAG